MLFKSCLKIDIDRLQRSVLCEYMYLLYIFTFLNVLTAKTIIYLTKSFILLFVDNYFYQPENGKLLIDFRTEIIIFLCAANKSSSVSVNTSKSLHCRLSCRLNALFPNISTVKNGPLYVKI